MEYVVYSYCILLYPWDNPSIKYIIKPNILQEQDGMFEILAHYDGWLIVKLVNYLYNIANNFV